MMTQRQIPFPTAKLLCLHAVRVVVMSILFGGMVFEDTLAADSPTSASSVIDLPPAAEIPTPDPVTLRRQAEALLQHVNMARLALAVDDPAMASQHLALAESGIEAMGGYDTTARLEQEAAAGRFTIGKGKDIYIFPAGPMTMAASELAAGPFWAKTSKMALEDADWVHISVSIDADKARSRIRDANAKIAEGDLPAATHILKILSNESIAIESTVPAPLQTANGNLALAAYFMAADNNDAARYALKHARAAIIELRDNTAYRNRQSEIEEMASSVDRLQQALAQKDPTLTEKAKSRILEWWALTRKWLSPLPHV